MKKNDLEIGPCWTDADYRGQGIYPTVLRYILSTFKGQFRKFFIFTDEDNIASQKGIIKAGFKLVGKGTKNSFGRYIINNFMDTNA